MFLKTHRVRKDGKEHIYYSLGESLRVSRSRVTQRTVLHLGELNTTQVDRWQRTIETIHEDGQRQQMRLFTDREGQAQAAEGVAEVVLSSLLLRRPRRFGDAWVGCKLWEELGLRAFWQQALGEERGEVPWAKVVELLAVNRLCAPRSELSIHEKWFPQTAMDLLLDTDASVAEKDRLYRCLDRMGAHKERSERHLAGKWRDLFGASFDVLLYDLTSTYFEGEAVEVDKARRGYSRDHRSDCLQILLAVVVTPEGFPLSYEVLPGNVRDEGTLDSALEAIERKHGKARRIWVFDRGVASEANLQTLRAGGAHVVGTPRSRLKEYEQRLLRGDWQEISKEVQVQLLTEGPETFVFGASADRAKKEEAMRWRQVLGLMGDLVRLRRAIRRGKLKDGDKILMRIGRLQERWPRGRPMWKSTGRGSVDLALEPGSPAACPLARRGLSAAHQSQRPHPAIVMEDVRAADRSEDRLPGAQERSGRAADLALDRKAGAGPRHGGFPGYCLWVCLKHKLKIVAPA